MESNSDTHSEIIYLHERELMRLEINNLKEQVRYYKAELDELKETLRDDKEIIRTLLKISTAGNSRSATRTDINISK